MADMDEIYKNKIVTFLRAFYAAKYAKVDNMPCQIEPGLFLGSVGVAYNKDALKNFNITHILVVAKSLGSPYPDDFHYKKIEAKAAGGGVLVHCFAGRSRSVTIVLAYLMKNRNMSLSEALGHVKSKRPQIAPNEGFILQLQNFEKSLGANRTKNLNVGDSSQ
ncbi:dual specificity protein phosphatase 1-like isoform X2 [Nymphaea colorata]|uniref:dual specificity protein phosphatase 1-like isoform X2 n=1 Tax=Nymphaea colorata TaxID=210225 RepID=UPI00129DC2F3|nr:dual specificity protein phosphatase 1-like isoform X2 [Nymphaea colorata]